MILTLNQLFQTRALTTLSNERIVRREHDTLVVVASGSSGLCFATLAPLFGFGSTDEAAVWKLSEIVAFLFCVGCQAQIS